MTTDVVSPPLDTAPELAVRGPRVPGIAWGPSRVAASWRRTPTAWVLAGALVAVAVRLPYLGAPLGSDEGGFLLVASQWRGGGTSLYGDYWVDRPPLLIGFFAAADQLGGSTALRLMGCGLAFSVVVLAHLLGREVTRRVSPVSPVSPWPVLAAVAFVCMPLTGTQEVNGELIALPLVLLGLLAALRATQHPARLPRLLLWTAAGSLGMAAAMVKQNFIDVFAFSVVILVASVWTRHARNRRIGRAARELTALIAGGLLAGGAALLAAASRGTTPPGLWDALVVFRLDAGTVIAQSASAATHDRLLRLLLMLCLSGAVVVTVVFAAHALRHPRQPVALATLVLLGWELLGVLGGGSYWLHYLLGLIPGLVLAVAQLTPRRGWLAVTARAAVGYAALVALISAPGALVVSPPNAGDPPASVWLEDHARPGDTATVLYGGPNILQAAGLTSPYPELWSLPVRVRDPHLAELRTVLAGQQPPTWLLTSSHDLTTWGVDPGSADAVVVARYEPVDTVDGYTVYHLRTGVTAVRHSGAASAPAGLRFSDPPSLSRDPALRAQTPHHPAEETS
jgi:hypothetical protein